MTVIDTAGTRHRGAACIGADGVKSPVRQQYTGNAVRVSSHVVYRAVVDAADFPADLRWNAPAVWAGPDCHLVYYPLRVHGTRSSGDFAPAFDHCQRSRVARTARVVLSAREMGRLYHARGVERLVRNDLWRGRPAERFHDAVEWLYGWRAERCLAA